MAKKRGDHFGGVNKMVRMDSYTRQLKRAHEKAVVNGKRVRRVMRDMGITSSDVDKVEVRKCYNCGKPFKTLQTFRHGRSLIVSGAFTCSWECTKALIDKGAL